MTDRIPRKRGKVHFVPDYVCIWLEEQVLKSTAHCNETMC